MFFTLLCVHIQLKLKTQKVVFNIDKLLMVTDVKCVFEKRVLKKVY
jgi:hypothetical protein